MKKVAVTGHTSGIGQAVADRLGTQIYGFSRSTGHDLNYMYDHDMLDQIEQCDVLINNAHVKWCQSELCLEMWRRWRNQDKIIVNIGSNIAELPEHGYFAMPEEHASLYEYWMQKRALKNLSEDLQMAPGKVTVRYVSFGYVSTNKILERYPDFSSDVMITPEAAAERILDGIL